MAKRGVVRRGARVAHPIVLPMVLMLAGCGPRFGGPAPVVNGGESLSTQVPAQVVIEHGQTLSGIARRYHVPMQAIAAANHLSPPYRILAGGTLIVPGGGVGFGSPPIAAPVAMVPSPPVVSPPEAAVATTPLPPPPELASRAAPPAPDRDRPIPLVRPVTAEPPPEIASRTPDQHADRALPPDRAPPSGSEASSTPPAASGATLTPPDAPLAPIRAETPRVASAEPAAHPPTAPGAAATAEPAPAHRGGTFLWPVRGHILENYGAGPDGTHNDGINIGAARGAPVQATDAGVVAYAGNELRGYGNLVLIKHPNGWISAYAHCDLILVRTGQKVARGQVIARVGSTGNVKEPQLHFELRRGKRPVDPRDYLAPLPSAATKPPGAG